MLPVTLIIYSLNTTTMNAKLDDALNQVTYDKCIDLDWGDSIDLNDSYQLYHYIDDDVIVVVQTDVWEEVFQILLDGDKNITFESLV